MIFSHEFRLIGVFGTLRAIFGRFHHIALSIFLSVEVHNAVLAHYVAIDLLRREHERIAAVGHAGYDVAAELRIEHSQLIDRHIQHSRNLLQVNTAGHTHGVGHNRFLGKTGTYVVMLEISHHIVCGNKGRHIATRFLGQIGINLPKVLFHAIFATGTAQRLVHIARTTIIGGNSQRPVAVDIVKFL